MTGALATSVGYAAIGGTSVFAGSIFATRRELSARARVLVHHAAAGTVLAGLVVDVFPKLLDRPHQLLYTAIGMVAGLVGMLAIRASADKNSGKSDGVGSLVLTVVTDILVDGVLIGLSAVLGAGTGLIFAIALAPEMGLLGVTAAEGLRDRWRARRIVAAAGGIGVAITAAGGLGWAVGNASAPLIAVALGLGASVIVYLILEELLREVHATDTGPVEVAVLFAFFLPFFLAGVAVR